MRPDKGWPKLFWPNTIYIDCIKQCCIQWKHSNSFVTGYGLICILHFSAVSVASIMISKQNAEQLEHSSFQSTSKCSLTEIPPTGGRTLLKMRRASWRPDWQGLWGRNTTCRQRHTNTTDFIQGPKFRAFNIIMHEDGSALKTQDALTYKTKEKMELVE